MGRLKGWEAEPAPAITAAVKRGIQTRILPPRKCRKARRTRKAQTGAAETGRDTWVLPTIGIPTPLLNEEVTSMKSPQGDFITSGHTMELVAPATRIRHTGSADFSGDQGATSQNDLAHRDGVLETKTGMLGRDWVISKLAMNITPLGRGCMRSSLQKSCYMEGQSGEGGTPTVPNPLELAYHFGPVKSTPDGYEAMVPAKSCDINIGWNQAVSAPTSVEACPLEKRGVPSPARSRPSVITRRRPPTVFK